MSELAVDDFALLLRQSGLQLTEAQTHDLREGYRLVRAMADLVHQSRDRELEPAHVFSIRAKSRG